MDNLEKVEKIREKTGVSYEDAKNALEQMDYNILDAIVYLEKNGKINNSQDTVYTTEKQQQSQQFTEAQKEYEKDTKPKNESFCLFRRRIADLLRKVSKASFVVSRRDSVIVKIPVILLLGFVCFAFWATAAVIIIGLFAGCSYHFEGFSKTSIDINEMCQKASEACDNIRKEFTEKKDDTANTDH